jgi:hypothetical protein
MLRARMGLIAWEVAMHCAYCGVDYNSEEACLCLPSVRAGKVEDAASAKVTGPWGEATAEWSAHPTGPNLNARLDL